MISSQISPALPHSSTRVEVPSRGDDKINYTAKTPRLGAARNGTSPTPPEQQSVVDDLNSNVDSTSRRAWGRQHINRPRPAPRRAFVSGPNHDVFRQRCATDGAISWGSWGMNGGTVPARRVWPGAGKGTPIHPIPSRAQCRGGPDWARFPVHVSGPRSVMDGNQPPSSSRPAVVFPKGHVGVPSRGAINAAADAICVLSKLTAMGGLLFIRGDCPDDRAC